MGAHPLRRLVGGDYYLIIGVGFLGLLAALGGASRSDEFQQVLVRLAAMAVIVAALWPLDFRRFRDARGPIVGLGLVYLLLLLQLVPLPPTLWAALPGRGVYASVALQTDGLGWRPWTLSPDLTLNALAALLPATAMGLVTLALDLHGRLLLARCLVGIACVSALLGLMQFASGGTSLHLFRTTSEDSAVGLFANRNHEAVLMACSLPILSALTSIRMRHEDSSGRNLVLAFVAGALLLGGLAATGSRMGLLLGVVGLATGAAIHVIATPPGTRWGKAATRLWPVGAAAAIAGLVAVSLLVVRSGSVARLASDPVDQTRLAALAPMGEAVRAFFPFGAGFGTFDPVYRRFEPDSLLSTIYLNQAHNEPMQLLIEGGLPALLLMLLFLGWWGRAAVRAVGARQSVSRRALGMAMAAATLILMLSSLVDYPLRTPLLSGLFAIACVELVRSRRRSEAGALS